MSDKIKVGIATEEEVNQEFINAWHRAEEGEFSETKEKLYFLDTETFLEILSQHQLKLLYTLRTAGKVNIKTLDNLLEKRYINLKKDVQLLKKVGLIKEASNENIFVPWDKIQAEIDLSFAPI